jgi:hypothetical protein
VEVSPLVLGLPFQIARPAQGVTLTHEGVEDSNRCANNANARAAAGTPKGVPLLNLLCG